MTNGFRTGAPILLLMLLMLLAGCSFAPVRYDPAALLASGAPSPTMLQSAAAVITADGLLAHVRVLSSDEFEGRAPGGKGEALTVDYLTQQFMHLGLSPGNPDGTYLQRVPMVGTTGTPTMQFSTGGRTIALRSPDDFVAFSARMQGEVTVDRSALVFVGYGVTAPEFGWDDYKGVDLRGKTLVMLINDPPVPDPADPARLDPAMFGGTAMTYYGRWTYKYERAARAGAAAAIIVHETKPAAYGYDVVRNSWSGELFFPRGEVVNPGYPPIAAWITTAQAKDLFAASGRSFDAEKAAALSRSFKPVALAATASIDVRNRMRQVDSANVVARIDGSDPVLRDEFVIYSAHWDHLGFDPTLPGGRTRQIYHGAIDNASGVATMLEIARAYKALPTAPKRTVLFIATTAEERGLLGAQYYAQHPLHPLHATLVDINIDGINPYGRTRDLVITGAGKSSADDVVRRVAARQGRIVVPEPLPENGSFYRADQFEFARAGIPGIYARSGSDFIDKPPGYGNDRGRRYATNAYHKVDDVIDPDWDLSGAVDDARLLFEAGVDIAEGAQRPAWRAGVEFQRAAPAP
jgi:Zn-dependent M28 family amino/carboxypeptidase